MKAAIGDRLAALAAPAPNEADIVARALALRKRRLIGILWAEDGRYWISASEYDPFGSRVRVSLAELKELVEQGERMPAQSEDGSGRKAARAGGK